MSRRRFLIGGLGVAGVAALGGFYVYRKFLDDSGNVKGSVNFSEYDGPSALLSELPENAEYDVCIVGSGPAGAFLCSELADRGVRVIVLEAGQSPSVTASDPRYAQLNGYRGAGSIDYPLSATHLIGPGGTSGLWNGRCPRLTPGDFEPNAYTPAGSQWPVSYAELEPFYARAEKSLRVEGDEQEYTHVTRSTPLPPNEPALPADAPVREFAQRAGFDGAALGFPPSSVSQNDDGPIRIARDVLPDVAKKAGVTLVLGATAHRFVEDESERIVAVLARDIDGRQKQIRARYFVVAGGAAETARRLLLNKSERWPEGLGNRHGRVGLSFSEHTAIKIEAAVDLPNVDHKRDGIYNQTRNFQLYEPFKKEGFGSVMLHMQVYPENNDRKSPRHVLRLQGEVELEFSDLNKIALSADPMAVDPFGDPYSELTFGFSARDQAMLEKTRQTILDIYHRMGIKDHQLTEQKVQTWAHHHLGTVRMGNDPATSVVDADLRVHGLKNLYLSTSGTFVTGGAVNPTLTIVALTHRLADHLHDQLQAVA